MRVDSSIVIPAGSREFLLFPGIGNTVLHQLRQACMADPAALPFIILFGEVSPYAMQHVWNTDKLLTRSIDGREEALRGDFSLVFERDFWLDFHGVRVDFLYGSDRYFPNIAIAGQSPVKLEGYFDRSVAIDVARRAVEHYGAAPAMAAA